MRLRNTSVLRALSQAMAVKKAVKSTETSNQESLSCQLGGQEKISDRGQANQDSGQNRGKESQERNQPGKKHHFPSQENCRQANHQRFFACKENVSQLKKKGAKKVASATKTAQKNTRKAKSTVRTAAKEAGRIVGKNVGKALNTVDQLVHQAQEFGKTLLG